jgi:hypothetical protein
VVVVVLVVDVAYEAEEDSDGIGLGPGPAGSGRWEDCGGAEVTGFRFGVDLRERRAEIRDAALVVRKEAREGDGVGSPATELGGVGREVGCWFAAELTGGVGVFGRDSSWARSLASSSS